jgi:hypothetical protein
MAKKKPAIGLSAHSFSVWQISEATTKLELYKLPPKDIDLFDYLEQNLTKMKAATDDIDRELLTRVVKLTVDQKARTISGILESGDYGQARNVVDKSTFKVASRIEVNQADMRPFYFLFHVPKRGTTGIMLTQTYKQFGIYTSLSEQQAAEFKLSNPTLRLSFATMSNSTLIDKMISEAEIKELTYTYTEFPDDIADSFLPQSDNKKRKEKSGKLKISIQAPRDGSLRIREKAKKLFGKNPETSGLINNRIVHIETSSASTIGVKVKYKDRYRTLNYGGGTDLASVYDISDDIKLNKDSHPTFESLEKEGRFLLDELLSMDREGPTDV